MAGDNVEIQVVWFAGISIFPNLIHIIKGIANTLTLFKLETQKLQKYVLSSHKIKHYIS